MLPSAIYLASKYRSAFAAVMPPPPVPDGEQGRAVPWGSGWRCRTSAESAPGSSEQHAVRGERAGMSPEGRGQRALRFPSR
jgi:hypothetical protein